MEEFLREEMILGSRAMERLRSAHVIVFGIGGVGSYAAEALARGGVGALTLVDNDTVGLTNINRQLCALHSTLGRFKARVMGDRILDINPACQVRALTCLYTDETRETFFDRHYDYVVDAIDLVSCKLSLIQRSVEAGIPIISAMGTGNKLDPGGFQIGDLADTSGCPLARIMRRELKKRGIFHHTVLFSREEARKPLPLEAPPPGRRTIPASVSWVPSCAGLMMGGYVLRALAGPLPEL